MSKVEAFWENATADDVTKIANTRKSIQARCRDEGSDDWSDCLLVGWKLSKHLPGARWIDADGAMWDHCQVYREPSWYANKPDPGPGWRLLGKLPDEELKPGDEGWDLWHDGKWSESDFAKEGKPQQERTWYRRRIEPVEPVESKPVLIRRWTVDPGDEIKLPNGCILVISQDGFEVTQ
jgi:hypothetical protein